MCQLQDQIGTKALIASVWWPGSLNKKDLVEAGQLLPFVSKALGFFIYLKSFSLHKGKTIDLLPFS